METSTLNGANGTRAHGIVPLSMNEIELVAGGKAAETPTSAWDRFVVWLEGWIAGLTSASAPKTTITPPSDSALIDMLKICRESGGGWEYQLSSGGGSAELKVLRADGAAATLRIACN